MLIVVFALGFLLGKGPHSIRQGTGVLESSDDVSDAASKKPLIIPGKHPHETQHPPTGPPPDVEKALVIASFREQDISWLNETPSA